MRWIKSGGMGHQRTIRILGAPAAVAAMAALAACSGPRSMLDPAGPSADGIATLWWVMFGGAVAVWLLVVALLLVALLRGRDTRPLARPQRLIVVGGLVLPTVLLGALLTWGTLDSARITGVGQAPDAVIEVIARQWFWEFRYLDTAGNAVAASRDELAMPLGQMVEFRITSQDVIHSFWIPRLGGKMDAVPGQVNRLRLRADHDGADTGIRGQCAEFCGFAHAHMHFEVRVLADPAWADWLAAHAIDATPTGAVP